MKRLQNPKSLPWLARKAGVSDQTAEALWHQAFALVSSGDAQTAEPARMADAMQRLLDLLDAEKQERNTLVNAADGDDAARFFGRMGGCSSKSGCAARLQ